MNLLTGGTGSGLGAPIGVNVRFTLATVGVSFGVEAALAGADNCLCTGFGATGLGPVILALAGAVLGASSDLVLKLVLLLCMGPTSTSRFLASGAACLEASAALAALIAVSLAA